MDIVDKPDDLLALHAVTAELFDTLRDWFDVPPTVTLSLDDVDSAVRELGDPQMIAAMAMRKLQGLRLLSQPGVRTSTDVIVTIVQDLERALAQAPQLRLRYGADRTDWDAAFADLVDRTADAPLSDPDRAPREGGDDAIDPEVQRFRQLHGALHQAVRAVIEASQGQIRYLE